MQVVLDDRTALVTGSGPGNGRETARLLAENGASVVVNDRDAEPAEGVPATGPDPIHAFGRDDDGEMFVVTRHAVWRLGPAG